MVCWRDAFAGKAASFSAPLLRVDTSSNVSGCTVLVPIGSHIDDLAIEERRSPGVTMTGPGRVTVVREAILVDHFLNGLISMIVTTTNALRFPSR